MRARPASRTSTSFGFLLVFLVWFLVAPPVAQAHGDTVRVEVTGQRDGHITTKITWEDDGDAVEEAVAATVNATSPDGSRSMGPWRLVRDPGTRTGWSTAEVLPPGTWKVTVDVGFPSLGHGEREVAVPVVDPVPPGAATPPTGPTPVSTVPSVVPAPVSTTPSPATPSASPNTAGDGGDRTTWWPVAALAGISLVGAAAGLLLRRARRRRR
ncbi:hypothetical protein [Streptomyces sp. bgisy060]|uniref:hypothetical protein n=1 Tax=Streptomyces sp. bgisy060 TaxID=3413775 RepID=UPI003EB76F21